MKETNEEERGEKIAEQAASRVAQLRSRDDPAAGAKS
jgi:hypothetical protein